MMQNIEIKLRPAVSFAVIQICPLILLSLTLLLLAWTLSPIFILLSLLILLVAWYRLLLIRSHRCLINSEYLQLTKGILFKRTDQLELYRIKDYVLTQPLTLQILGLSNLSLKSTDEENPVINMFGISNQGILEQLRERVQAARQANQIIEMI